ncbi:MAG: hypothetical protein P4L84_07085 [Isosphaeraceae bacterium]|nr:hypothetical protein [Isosphaeraceae bacterium]
MPIVTIVGFGCYFFYQNLKSHARQQIITWKTEGDQLQEAGQLRQALEKYQAVVAQGNGSSDSDVQRAVSDGKARRDKLLVVLKAELEREEAERQRQEQERQRLARLKEQEEAEAQARRVAEQLRLKEEAELAKIKASVIGGAWVIKGGGQSDILRGLSIYVLRAEVARRELDEAVRVMKSQPDFDQFGGDATGLPSRPPDDRVSLEWLFRGVRYRKNDDASGNVRMRRIKNDSVWRAIAKTAVAATAETNIDGKYKIPEVKGGKYLVYAIHDTSFSLIEWLVPLEIAHPGEVTLDLYNKNSETIINKSDDD